MTRYQTFLQFQYGQFYFFCSKFLLKKLASGLIFSNENLSRPKISRDIWVKLNRNLNFCIWREFIDLIFFMLKRVSWGRLWLVDESGSENPFETPPESQLFHPSHLHRIRHFQFLSVFSKWFWFAGHISQSETYIWKLGLAWIGLTIDLHL